MVTKKVVKVILELSEEEAVWLKTYMSGPMKDCKREEEGTMNCKMRHKFFKGLPVIGN